MDVELSQAEVWRRRLPQRCPEDEDEIVWFEREDADEVHSSGGNTRE